MIYNLPANNLYGDLPVTIDFPDNWEIHVSEINGYNKKPMECTELKKAMDQPVGVPTIKEGAKNKKVLSSSLMISLGRHRARKLLRL